MADAPTDPTTSGPAPAEGEESPTSVDTTSRLPSRDQLLRYVADAVAVVVLLFPFLWLQDNDGGFQLEPMSHFVWFAIPAAIVLSPELRRLPRPVVWVIALVPLGALVSFAVAWDRSGFVKDAQVFSTMPVVALAVARLWRRPKGPLVLAGLFAACWLVWFWNGLLLWWGFTDLGSQPRWELVSWRNQSGILSASFGVLFLSGALVGRKWVALLGGALSATALAGVWLSSSRGSVFFAAVAIAMLTAAAWRHRSAGGKAFDGLPALGRTAFVLATTGALVSALLLMVPEGRSTPLESRTQDVATNTSARTYHWEAAWGMFTERPLFGDGLGSYRHMAVRHNPPEGNLTASAHNEWLEAYAEGGLVLGLPMTALGLLLLGGAWRLRRDVSMVDPGEATATGHVRAPLLLGLGSTAGLVGAHTLIDFDLRYPVVAMIFAAGLGALAGVRSRGVRRRRVAVGAILPTVLLGCLATAGAAREIQGFGTAPDPTSEPLAYGRHRAPWDVESRIVTVRNLLGIDEAEAALRTAQDLADWSPRNPATPVYLGYAELALGHIGPQELLSRLQPPPTRLNLYLFTARQLLDAGHPEEAITAAYKGIDVFSEYRRWGVAGTAASSWATLIEAHAALGRCHEVPDVLSAAVDQLTTFNQQQEAIAALTAASDRLCPA